MKVSDPACDQPPALIAKAGQHGKDRSPRTLDPGDTWTYQCSHKTAAPPSDCTLSTVNNTATATATAKRTTVRDHASITTTLDCPGSHPSRRCPRQPRLARRHPPQPRAQGRPRRPRSRRPDPHRPQRGPAPPVCGSPGAASPDPPNCTSKASASTASGSASTRNRSARQHSRSCNDAPCYCRGCLDPEATTSRFTSPSNPAPAARRSPSHTQSPSAPRYPRAPGPPQDWDWAWDEPCGLGARRNPRISVVRQIAIQGFPRTQ